MTEENPPQNQERLRAAREYWDQESAAFDQEPDHGLLDPRVLRAWTDLLALWLPPNPGDVLDVGCGTGSLSVVLAGLGHSVTGVDLSPAMIERAQAKALAHGFQIVFQVMDAAAPQFAAGAFDVIACRHLLWTLPEPARVLERWVKLLKPDGRFLLIEGQWSTGAGLRASEIAAALPPSLSIVAIQDLSGQPVYWGKRVTDERYLIVADLVR